MIEIVFKGLVWGSLLLSAAVLLVALLRPLVRRLAGAQGQYALWWVLPAMLLAGVVAALQPERSLRWEIQTRGLQAFERPAAAPAAVAGGRPQAPRLPAERVTAPLEWAAWVAPGALLLWLAGALACALSWALAQARMQRQRRLPAGSSAALIGAWRPQLRLPVDFRQRFSASERRLILLHERLHAERGDTRWLALALVLLALQWFNPLAWWAMGRLRADMELACDAALLARHPRQLATYRQALLRAQGVGLPLSATPCATHPLVERLRLLPQHGMRGPRRGLVALVVLSSAGLAYAMQPTLRPQALPPAIDALVVEAASPGPAARTLTPMAEDGQQAMARAPEPAPDAEPAGLPSGEGAEAESSTGRLLAAAPSPQISVDAALAAGPRPALGEALRPLPSRPADAPPTTATAAAAEPAAVSDPQWVRLDYRMIVNGQASPPQMLLRPLNELVRLPRVRVPGDADWQISLTPQLQGAAARPDGVRLAMEWARDRRPMGRPAVATPSGKATSVKMEVSTDRMSIELQILPRLIASGHADLAAAEAELKDEIARGSAPAIGAGLGADPAR